MKICFIIEQEFVRTLKVMMRKGNTLSAIIRDAWDLGRLQIATKKNAMMLEGAHVSIIGHITKQELRRHLNDTESCNGFANRFYWMPSERSKCLPEGGSLSDDEVKALADLLDPAIAFGKTSRLLKRDAEATQLWAEIYEDLSDGKPGIVGSVTSRGEAQVLRTSMLYALLDCSEVIRRVHLVAALALWKTSQHTVEWIFDSASGEPLADTIFNLLLQNGGMTQNAIQDHFGRHKTKAVTQALSSLQQQGRVHLGSQQTAGRPARFWTVIGSQD